MWRFWIWNVIHYQVSILVFTLTNFGNLVNRRSCFNSWSVRGYFTSLRIKSISCGSFLLPILTFLNHFRSSLWKVWIFTSLLLKWDFFFNYFWFRTNFNDFRFTWVFHFTSNIKLRLLTFVNNGFITLWRFWIWNVVHYQVSVLIFTLTNFSDLVNRRSCFYRWSIRSHLTSLRIKCVSSCSFLLTIFTFLNHFRSSFWKVWILTSLLLKWDFFFNYFRFCTNFDNLRFTWVYNLIALSLTRFTWVYNILSPWI